MQINLQLLNPKKPTFIIVLFTFTFETTKWVTRYIFNFVLDPVISIAEIRIRWFFHRHGFSILVYIHMYIHSSLQPFSQDYNPVSDTTYVVCLLV